MPKPCLITGSFTCKGRPVQGLVRFTPSRLWVMQDGVAWACLAPRIVLDRNGCFIAHVTSTNTDAVPWHYLVETPAGRYKIEVPWHRMGYSLRELIREYRPQPRP